VIRERSFERQLRALIQDAREADDFVEAAEFVLARDPEIGSPMDNGIWFLPMAPIGKAQVALYYTFDDSHVRRFDGHAARHRECLSSAWESARPTSGSRY
jgi:hypothetical protein